MKQCSKCNNTKSLEDFSKNSSRRDGKQVWCKSCMSEYDREAYRSGKRKKIEESRVKTRERNRLYILDYLQDKSCVDCGNDDLRVLEFDHIRGDKVENISSMVSGSYSIARIQHEIDKCEICCANCHRIRTGNRNGFYK